MMGAIIRPNGEVQIEDFPASDGPEGLAWVNKQVGGYIEAIYFPKYSVVGYVNEEGQRLNLPENPLATNLWWNFGHSDRNSMLLGTAVFFGVKPPVTVDLPQIFVELIARVTA